MKKILFAYFIFLGGLLKAAETQSEHYSKISKKRSAPKKEPYTVSNQEKVNKLAKEKRKEQNRLSARRRYQNKKELILRLEASVHELMQKNTQQTLTINQQAEKLVGNNATIKKQDAENQKLYALCRHLQIEKNQLAQEKALFLQQIAHLQQERQFANNLFTADLPSGLVYNASASATFDGPTISYELQSSLTQQ